MDIFELLGRADATIGVLGAILAGLAWIQSLRNARQITRWQQRQRELVTIELFLTSGQQSRALPFQVPRQSVVRNEVLGLLGMLPLAPAPDRKPGDRYRLRYLAQPAFFQQLAAVQRGEGSRIVIPCTDEEFAQFA